MSAGDEFSGLRENAEEVGLAWSGPPVVRRESVEVADGRCVSALVWGRGPPELVLLHGGAQNAHTWDTVALALDRPLVAVDLPGHGHSGWRQDHQYLPVTMASDVAVALHHLLPQRHWAPQPRVVVGMSLGGLTALCLVADHPDLVTRLALVDVTPGTDAAKTEPILAFLAGPERFGSFEEILARTIAFNPTRSVASLRRGVIHNVRELPDGSWAWRWDPSARWRSRPASASPTGHVSGAGSSTQGHRAAAAAGAPVRAVDPAGAADGAGTFASLWSTVAGLRVPVTLIRGARSSVVSDDDAAQLMRLQPEATVVVVPEAGHSVQGDQPVALARLIGGLLDA